MTQNAWKTDQLNANGEVLIGNGTSSPSASTITNGTNCTIVNGANSVQFTYSGSTSGDWVLTHSASASSSAQLTFTGLSSTYFAYVMVIDNYKPGTDTERLKYQLSTDNGSTWDSTSNYYFRGWEVNNSGSVGPLEADSTSSNVIGSSGADPGNATNETCSSISWFYNPNSTTFTRVTNIGQVIDSAGAPFLLSIESGRESAAAAVDAIRLFNDAGNIATAEVRLYGVLAA